MQYWFAAEEVKNCSSKVKAEILCSVASMRQRVTAVAAANRHTVVLAEGGTVYSWGSNLQGQLGYGTSDSASNAVPRIVEAMKVCTLAVVAGICRP